MGKSPTIILGLIRLADMALIAILALAWYWLRHDSPDLPPRYWLAIVICCLLTVQAFHMARLYVYPLISGVVAQVAILTTAWLAVVLILLALMFFTKTAEDFSRLWAAGWLFSCYVGFLAVRLVAKLRIDMLFRQGRLTRRVAIVGAGEHGRRLIMHLRESPRTTSIEIVGVFDDRRTRVPQDELAGIPIRGTTSDLIELCRRQSLDLIIVALPWSADRRLIQIMTLLRQLPVDLQLAPEEIGFRLADRPVRNLSGVPMLTIFEKPMSGWDRLIKGAEDRLLAVVLLLLVSPLLALIAVAIKLESPGPVLFRQQRLGFNNRPFTVYKFRTMYREAGDDPYARQAVRNDPRVTRLGSILRRTSMDELPQLLNVLNGSMSLVGPRPHALAHNEAFAKSVREYYARYRVKPGITGWAQVHGFRGETDTRDKLEKRVEFDLYYIDNWSLFLDLKIILMTCIVIFAGKHAY